MHLYCLLPKQYTTGIIFMYDRQMKNTKDNNLSLMYLYFLIIIFIIKCRYLKRRITVYDALYVYLYKRTQGPRIKYFHNAYQKCHCFNIMFLYSLVSEKTIY